MSHNAVEEVRDFLEQLPQRSPQEAIGMRDEGGLMQGMLLGTALLAILTLAGTALPYFLGSSEPVAASAPTAPKDAERAETAADDNPGTDAESKQADAEAPADAANPDRVLDNLGIGEAKDSAPEVNPLENDLDNLLDGVK